MAEFVTNKITMTREQAIAIEELVAMNGSARVELWQTDNGQYVHLYVRVAGRKYHVAKNGNRQELD